MSSRPLFASDAKYIENKSYRGICKLTDCHGEKTVGCLVSVSKRSSHKLLRKKILKIESVYSEETFFIFACATPKFAQQNGKIDIDIYHGYPINGREVYEEISINNCGPSSSEGKWKLLRYETHSSRFTDRPSDINKCNPDEWSKEVTKEYCSIKIDDPMFNKRFPLKVNVIGKKDAKLQYLEVVVKKSEKSNNFYVDLGNDNILPVGPLLGKEKRGPVLGIYELSDGQMCIHLLKEEKGPPLVAEIICSGKSKPDGRTKDGDQPTGSSAGGTSDGSTASPDDEEQETASPLRAEGADKEQGIQDGTAGADTGGSAALHHAKPEEQQGHTSIQGVEKKKSTGNAFQLTIQPNFQQKYVQQVEQSSLGVFQEMVSGLNKASSQEDSPPPPPSQKVSPPPPPPPPPSMKMSTSSTVELPIKRPAPTKHYENIGHHIVEITVRCIVKLATIGPWVVGCAYILSRFTDCDPEVYMKILGLPLGIVICAAKMGSINFLLQATTLGALDELWDRYKTGQLEDDFKRVMVTEELKNLAGGEPVEFSVKISEEEYRKARRELITAQGKVRLTDGRNEDSNQPTTSAAAADGSTASPRVDPADADGSSASPHVDPADADGSTASPHIDPADADRSTASSRVDPADADGSSASPHVDPADADGGTALPHVDPADADGSSAYIVLLCILLYFFVQLGYDRFLKLWLC